jgi:SAM-dependent methyltransferase
MRLDDDPLLSEQVAYYEARAAEYDRMLATNSEYGWDIGGRSGEFATKLYDLTRDRDVLEIACGTGSWTRRLAACARSVTAIDAAPAMLAIHRQRVPGRSVRRIQADIFSWSPDRKYDVVFFALWLSHVPLDLFAQFWEIVGRALRPDGLAIVVDEQRTPAAAEHEWPLGDGRGTTIRRLEDGREFRMVKIYYTAETLTAELERLGFRATWRAPCDRFYYAIARRKPG